MTGIGIVLLVLFEVIRALFKLDPGYYLTVGLRSLLVILVGQFCSTEFRVFTGTKIWKILTRNLLNVYLFHDPLEYVILRVFMTGDLMSKAVFCWLFYILRSFGTVIVSIAIGELLRYLKKMLRLKKEPISIDQ